MAQTKQGRFLTSAKKAPLFRPHRSQVGLFLVKCGGRGWARPLCASGSVLCVLKAAKSPLPSPRRGEAPPASGANGANRYPPQIFEPFLVKCSKGGWPCFPSAAAARVVLGFVRFPIVRARAPVAEGCEDICGLGFVLVRVKPALLYL